MEEVWGYRSFGDTRAVGVHVGHLRRKLGDSSEQPRYIQTVRGAGYKLVAPAEDTSAAAPIEGADRAAAPATTPAVTFPAPASVTGPSLTDRAEALVGRAREMADLLAAWDDACRGYGNAVLLVGDAGIGKTRLAEELAHETLARGGAVAWGRCHEAEGLPAYWPWIQVLRGLTGLSSDEELKNDLGEDGPELAVLLPEIRERLPGLEAEATAESRAARGRFFRALTDYVVGAARRRPLLVVLDDLHWADPSSLLVLQTLAPALARASVLLVATYRETEVDPQHPLSGILGALTGSRCLELRLEGLPPEDVERVMTLSTGVETSPAVARAVQEETGGNPLFVVELSRLLAAEGLLLRADPVSLAELPLPRGIRSVLDRRIARLGPDCRGLVGLAALIGRSFDVLVLGGAADLPGDRLVQLLDEAIVAGLLEREATPGRFRFSHPLVRDAMAGQLGEGERLRLHARIGETLETHSFSDPNAYLPDLAYHFSRAAPLGYGPQALRYTCQAGESALTRYGYEEAAQQFSRALTLLPCADLDGEAQRRRAIDLHESVGDALALSAQRHEAVQAYQRAEVLLPPADLVRRARLERKAGAAWLADQEPHQAQACFDSAEASLGPTPEEEDGAWWHEWVEITLQRMAALYFTGDLERLSALIEDARPRVEHRGDEGQRAIFATGYLTLAFRRERYVVSAETVAHAREHRRQSAQAGADEPAREAEFLLGFSLLWAGDLEAAQRHLRASAKLAEEARDHRRLVQAHTYLTILHRLRDQVEPARESAGRSMEQATAAHLPGYVAAAKATLAWAALRDGETASAEEHAREALELWRAPSAFPFEWLARGPLLSLLLGRDDLDGAMEQAEALLERRQQSLPTIMSEDLEAAAAAWRSGDAAETDGRLRAALAAALPGFT
jgi:hypothetical protein